MTERAFGWRADAADARDHDAAALLGRLGAAPGSSMPSLRPYRPARMFQGAAGTCVAFALSRAINIFHRITQQPGAKDPPMPAQRWIYAIAQRQEHAGVDPRTTPMPPLRDEGCFPRLAMRAVRALGFVPAEVLPYDAALVTQELDPLLVQQAVDQSGMEYARIFETGLERVHVVKELVRSGVPVIFGLTVDNAYAHHTGDSVIEGVNVADALGGHMQAVLGVTDDNLVDVDNWWHGWGDEEGTARLDPFFFGSDVIGDVYAVRSAPLYSGE